MAKQRKRKSLEYLEKEIEELKKQLQERQAVTKATDTLHEIDVQLLNIKTAILAKEKDISMKQSEKRDLMAELRKKQSIRRQQVRYTNQLIENYAIMERKLQRKAKEMERRFNPSSREMG